VSGHAIFKGNAALGVLPNRVFGTLDALPKHVGLTLNSDTPYAPVLLDLSDGPIVIELPPGPLICIAMDMNQRWVLDMGLPGPDAGQGGTHVILGPGHHHPVPTGWYSGRSTTARVLAGIRSLPVGRNVDASNERLRTVKVRPLEPRAGWTEPTWLDLNGPAQDTTPNSVEEGLGFWQELHEVVQIEPLFDEFRVWYGELAVLGIVKGQPFTPDARMTRILERAARIGNAQMRVQSFADRRPDRVVWPGRQWQWAALRFENGDFERPDSLDLEAREKWFFQAIGASPAMFRRDTKAGSLYWLGLRDADGAYLDGGQTYSLTVPLPVPGKLFWSVTVYDAQTRSQIQTPQAKAVLSSLFDLRDAKGDDVTVHFGPRRWTVTSVCGCRPTRVPGGSCTSASTAPKPPRSTAPGNSPTSNGRRRRWRTRRVDARPVTGPAGGGRTGRPRCRRGPARGRSAGPRRHPTAPCGRGSRRRRARRRWRRRRTGCPSGTPGRRGRCRRPVRRTGRTTGPCRWCPRRGGRRPAA